MSKLLSDELVARLELGQLRAAARRASWIEGKNAQMSRDFAIIEPGWWRRIEGGGQTHYDNLWRTGGIRLYLPDLKIDGVVHAVSFSGVRFETAELSQLLSRPIKPRYAPPEPASAVRSVAARNYDPRTPAEEAQPPAAPVAEGREWLPARDARELVNSLYSHYGLVEPAIVHEAAAGRVATRCDIARVQRDSRVQPDHYGERRAIEASFWIAYERASSTRQGDWIAGRFSYWTYQNYEQKTTHAHGVEFAGDDLRRIFNLDAGPAHQGALALYRHKKAVAQRTGRVAPPYAAKSADAPERPRKATKDELRQWFPIYEASSDDFRFDSVMGAAKKHFHPRPVTRGPLREIIGEFERTRTRGKPAAS